MGRKRNASSCRLLIVLNSSIVHPRPNFYTVRKKMLSVYHETAIGTQFSSLKSSSLSIGFGKATRSDREKIHLSREHDKTTPNLESPGPIYSVHASSAQGPAHKFGTGPQRYRTSLKSTPSSNDLLGSLPDDQCIKFRKMPQVLFGTDSRDKIKNAVILRDHPQASYGMESPGPLGYVLPDLTGKGAPAISMALKVRIPEAQIQTPVTVGPGSYPIATTCGGSQFNSSIPNQPVFSFGKAAQRVNPPRLKRSESQPIVADAFLEVSIGTQPESRRATLPRPVIGNQSRDHWTKQALLPERSGSCTRIQHPALPNRLELIRWGS